MSGRFPVALLLALALGPRPLAAMVSSSEPTGLLVFPLVVVDAAAGSDTLIRLTNVSQAAVTVRCTYVDGSLADGTAAAFSFPAQPDRQLAWLASAGLANPADPGHPLIPRAPAPPFTGTLRCEAVDDTGAGAGDALIGTATIQHSAPSGDSATYAATGFHAAAAGTDGNAVLVLGGANAEYDACPAESVLQSFLDGALVELGADGAVQRETATTLVLVTCSQDPTLGAETVATFSLTNEFGEQYHTSRLVREQLVIDLSRIDTDMPQRSIFNIAVEGSPTASIHIAPGGTGSGLLALALTAFVDPNDAARSFSASVHPQLIGERATADSIDLTVPTPQPSACTGDCDGDGTVAINELITGVNIALGNQPVTACTAFDADGGGTVTISELISGVNAALNGCS